MLVTLSPVVVPDAEAVVEAGAEVDAAAAVPEEEAVEGVGDNEDEVVDEPDGEAMVGLALAFGFGGELLFEATPLCWPLTTGDPEAVEVATLDGC